MRENSFTDRTVCVTVFRADGTGIEIREPACIEGRAVLDRTGQPNESFVEILNASEEFRSQVRNDEFRLMRIEAGHLNADNKAVIFEGNIIRSIAEDPRARDNDVSSVIYAGEGQISFRFSTLETTFPTGTTARQAVRAALAKMPEVTEGNLSGLDDSRLCKTLILYTGPSGNFFMIWPRLRMQDGQYRERALIS